MPDSLDPDAPAFPPPGRGRTGYAADQVDAFVGEVARVLRHEAPAMAPDDVVHQRFPTSRRGRRYDMRAVDEHLDTAEAALRQRHGGDVVAGRPAPPAQPRTWWIYALALVLVAAIVAFAVTQL